MNVTPLIERWFVTQLAYALLEYFELRSKKELWVRKGEIITFTDRADEVKDYLMENHDWIMEFYFGPSKPKLLDWTEYRAKKLAEHLGIEGQSELFD